MDTVRRVARLILCLLLSVGWAAAAGHASEASADTLLNVVQWPTSAGGNDHYYGIIPIVQPWVNHRDLALTLDHAGQPGYLATVTSAEENAFVKSVIANYTDQPSVADEFYLGGHYSGGGWSWLTDEPFAYTNWAAGQPAWDGLALAMWGASTPMFGTWNDVPHDTTGIGGLHQLWALIEFGSTDTTTPPDDTLLNVVQWPASAGGNDHYYGIIPIVQPWVNHRDLALTLDHAGQPGYLATVTSAEENAFVKSVIANYTDQPSVADEFYLGGHYTDSTWIWLTGEPFVYQNWDFNEPSGDGPALAMWGASRSDYGYWNDVPEDTVGIGSIHQLWALIEFGGAARPEDSLFFPSISGPGCAECDQNPLVQPVSCLLTKPAVGATVSIKIPAGATVCDVSFAGYLTESWDFLLADVKNDSGFVVVNIASSTGDHIPIGLSTLFDIRFTADGSGGPETYFLRWDTALSSDPGRQTKFADTLFATFSPGFDVYRDAAEIVISSMSGDADGSGSLNVGDISFIVEYIFRGGPTPCNLNAADVNGDCQGPDIGDLTYLISYLFRGGEAPRPGCVLSGSRADAAAPVRPVAVHTTYDGTATLISVESETPLRGLQLELSTALAVEPTLLSGETLDVVHGTIPGGSRVGVLDLEGSALIPSGNATLIRIEGKHELLSARVSDLNHQVQLASLATGPSLPTHFALAQNFPNPFNPTTNINFSLPVASRVRLEIFNVIGQRVALLSEGLLEAGEHNVTWDARSQASGVYLYRLTAENFTATKKMLLLK